jgi:hypothetical protein
MQQRIYQQLMKQTAVITTLAAIYCASKGTKMQMRYIKKVQLGDINNSSTNGNGYSDFTAVTTNLTIERKHYYNYANLDRTNLFRSMLFGLT